MYPSKLMAGAKQGLVFISCGQYTADEKKLGQDLAAAVDELTDFEGYFAQDQTSLEGLSRNIFGSLNRCSAFVAVLHRRGDVETLHGKHTRASVWVEQEIAIAAFLRQAQERSLEVAVYVQRHIKREGVRDQLHLNHIEFETEDEVLSNFRARIIDGRFKPVRLPPPKDVDLQLGFKTISRNAVHLYRLELTITNTGTEALKDYWIELQFPRAVLNNGTIWGAVKTRDTGTHTFIRATRDNFGIDLFPGDPLATMPIDYHMDTDLYRDASVLAQPVVASFGSPGMVTKRIEKEFRYLQDF